MPSAKDGLRLLLDERDALRAQVSELTGRLAGIQRAIDILNLSEPQRERAPRASVKQQVLSLLEERKDQGLNATLAVELAAGRDMSLDRASVASLLSRLKHEGVVTHDGNLYRLKTFSGSVQSEPSKLEEKALLLVREHERLKSVEAERLRVRKLAQVEVLDSERRATVANAFRNHLVHGRK